MVVVEPVFRITIRLLVDVITLCGDAYCGIAALLYCIEVCIDLPCGKTLINMNRNLCSMVLGLVGLALVIGCGKTGPAGATGPQGTQGSTGAAGPQGPQGNANVKVDTFSLTSAQWLYNSQYSLETSPGSYTEYFTRYHTLNLASVTQGILDSGMVMVYMVPNPLANTKIGRAHV